MEITGYTVGEVLGTTAVTGTFIYFIIKGFINPKADWLTIYTITFIAMFLLWYLSSPVALYDNILFNAFNALLFFGGLAGSIKYYWQMWKRKRQVQS
ncbi:hypothetical protein DBR40_13160 [Pedobacter sp. KBW01]|uniref:hypothetical protein n=1 Tax=Pedobacter sp. KBW01 TaxID=2153364 RepID=UPI000F5B4818|nr:hypothetical protein [Pedobacter sp. KBW01]RQO73753.1 hypothetical protein DBR40_13160 [Pedobacter sp. KBW01]